jgi:hypothetical protein
MLTKKQLCEAKLRQYAVTELGFKLPVNLDEIPEATVMQSSTIAVCMEYLGLLKDPTFKEYAASRGGLIAVSHDEDKNPIVISFRDILEAMKE